MPRIYKKKLGPRGNRNYDPVYLERAVVAVHRGMSIRTASEEFAIPYTTLHRWVKDADNKLLAYGRPPALKNMEEETLVQILLICAEWGFPLKSFDVRYMVQQYLNKCGLREKRFKDNLPGLDWFKKFMLRHPNLTVKLAENTKRVRAAVTYEVVETYFSKLKDSLKDILPANIINYDETNFCDDPGAIKVVVKRGIKHAHRIIDSSKSSTSVMFAISGDGNLLPPYVVYKAKHLYPGWTEGGFPGSRYNRTSSGWFDSCTFEDWFNSTALSYMRNLDGPKVIIGDNLCSHLTISVIQQCEIHNIRFILLPPNSTHLLQPLDVAYFRPFKGAWRNVLEQWKIKNRGVLPKTIFPRLLNETIEKIGARSSVNAQAGFKACGILPFNPDAVLRKIVRIIPREEQQEVERVMQTRWSDTIVTHLSEMRSGGEQAPKRGRKMNVSPGKSIRATDLLAELIEPESGEADDGNCSEQNIEIYENEVLEDKSDENNQAEREDENKTDMNNLASTSREPDHVTISFGIGNFVIVKFNTNKRDRLYIGKIESENDNEYTVNILRRKGSQKQIVFTYPQVTDISVVQKSQIIKKVYGHADRRGQFIFHDISNYSLE